MESCGTEETKEKLNSLRKDQRSENMERQHGCLEHQSLLVFKILMAIPKALSEKD